MKFISRHKKQIFFSILSVSVSIASLLGCVDDPSNSGSALAKINDYELRSDDFDRQLSAELELDPDFKLTYTAKKRFLERLIRKELMIQEAIRLKLDHEEKFVKAIERYWQSTLIRDLMLLKGEEINKKTYVTQEEIESRYLKIRESGETDLQLEAVREQILSDLKEEKKTNKLQEWVNGLQENAIIEIDGELLKKTG